MPRTLEPRHVNKYARPEYMRQSSEEHLERSEAATRREVAALEQKLADLLAAVAGAEGAPLAEPGHETLAKAIIIPERWFEKSIGGKNSLRSLEREEKALEAKRQRPTGYAARFEQFRNGNWEAYPTIIEDYRAIAAGEVNERLQQIWSERYPNWKQEDFVDLLRKCGAIEEEPIQTQDAAILHALFHERLQDDLSETHSVHEVEETVEDFLKEFLLAQGVDESKLEELNFDIDTEETDSGRDLNLFLFGKAIARVETDREDYHLIVHMISSGITYAFKDLLEKYLPEAAA